MIIAITDRKISATRDFLEQVEAIAYSNPDMIILREKDLSDSEYRYLAIECQRICSYHNIKFCVNSYINIADSLGDGRVQLPFASLKANADKLSRFEEIWVSVHSVTEAKEAEEAGATHLIYGNVFETPCKPGAKGRGIKDLKEVCSAVKIPVFATGGIEINNAEKVIEAGCKGFCVRSLLMQSGNPLAEMEGLKERDKKK
ncbi:MAG: thiamine phosphate synthase [Methanomassiliicoccaceae archaeon]|nr:thiamine phosphate synthase [Methanomassiliicoccaceae archaeon]